MDRGAWWATVDGITELDTVTDTSEGKGGRVGWLVE